MSKTIFALLLSPMTSCRCRVEDISKLIQELQLDVICLQVLTINLFFAYKSLKKIQTETIHSNIIHFEAT